MAICDSPVPLRTDRERLPSDLNEINDPDLIFLIPATGGTDGAGIFSGRGGDIAGDERSTKINIGREIEHYRTLQDIEARSMARQTRSRWSVLPLVARRSRLQTAASGRG